MKKVFVILIFTLAFAFDSAAQCLPPEVVTYSCDSTSSDYYDCLYDQELAQNEAEQAYQNCVAEQGMVEMVEVCSTTNSYYYGNGWFTGERDDYSDDQYGAPCDPTFVSEQTSNTFYYSDWDGSSCSVPLPLSRTVKVVRCHYVESP
ncbi:MAG TPA: hypothetical protein DEH24_02295 [Alteromonas sp.]|nr:hypothetical protein [Aestuariibacter sp.]MAP19834.1 hypothetical protein [Alteromonadaceae bacterium]MAX44691.1 hypothetical protein [Alteromonadaceae bacterium]HBY38215.1 hypothetical protein [Alteromonas sp.]|tara:strand:+ start:17489 stop:17929 length:441 start_codon:yes stop_codon:yes gene_type:complete